MKRLCFGIAVFALAASTALAQTAKQQAGIDEDKKTIEGYAKSMNITCDSHIVVLTDYASYKAVGGVDEDHNAPWHDCRNAMDTVDLVCRVPMRRSLPCRRRSAGSAAATPPVKRST